MKTAIHIAFILTSCLNIQAQENNDSLIQKRIRYQQYVFVPQSCSSPSATMPVSSLDYKVEITPDSVIANLPYFGKSHTPQFGGVTTDDVIVFTSTEFEYSAIAKKKGRWEITILPKDARGLRLFLTIYNNGDAVMDVTSPRKETITFKGYVW